MGKLISNNKNLSRELKDFDQSQRLVFKNSDTIIYQGKRLINLASNDYLGLSKNKQIIKESVKWLKEYGSSLSSSRLVTGNLDRIGLIEDLISKNILKSLFGEDYCVFIQNFIQAPTWWSNECTPKFVEGLYKKCGFKNVKRLSSFTKRSDIRKYFAPLHYDLNHPISQLLYGEGYVQYVGEKI